MLPVAHLLVKSVEHKLRANQTMLLRDPTDQKCQADLANTKARGNHRTLLFALLAVQGSNHQDVEARSFMEQIKDGFASGRRSKRLRHLASPSRSPPAERAAFARSISTSIRFL